MHWQVKQVYQTHAKEYPYKTGTKERCSYVPFCRFRFKEIPADYWSAGFYYAQGQVESSWWLRSVMFIYLPFLPKDILRARANNTGENMF